MPRVLVVDDSLTVRMDLVSAFAERGIDAIPCASAEEARRAVAEAPVDLIVLDVVLPDGDGVELMAELRGHPHGAGSPIILLSGEAEVGDRIRGLGKGADEYVGKPYGAGYVVARGKELMAAREGSAGDSILVVDDSPTFRAVLSRALENRGYRVIQAESGEEGLRLAAETRPVAMIVDGIMPGIDGPTAIRRIRLDAALRGTVCLLLTASGEDDAEAAVLDAGADAYLRKDEDMEIVLARLEAVLRSAAPASAEARAERSLMGPKRILAVDDSLTYLQEAGEALREEGYDVALCRAGEEAIELLQVQSFDCILLDMIMPGLGGNETCARIKASRGLREIPVVILTSLEGNAAMLEGLAAGADDYIAKSADMEVLKARVRAQIRRRQFENENRRIRGRLQRAERDAAEANAARLVAEARAALVEELEAKNRELEAFSYSVSHDLRAPLRAIDGFSRILIRKSADRLDEKGKQSLERIVEAARRMNELIDDLLGLSRVGRAALTPTVVDLSALAASVLDALRNADPDREVRAAIAPGLLCRGDPNLLRILLENLLGNAWKFTRRATDASVEVGTEESEGGTAFFVRDNGAGFNMAYAEKLFAPFQRLHSTDEFPGTGIGLAIVHRIVDRHGGKIWARSGVGQGATFFWTLACR